MQNGDTLVSLARDYKTDWLQLWGANPHIANPNRLAEPGARLARPYPEASASCRACDGAGSRSSGRMDTGVTPSVLRSLCNGSGIHQGLTCATVPSCASAGEQEAITLGPTHVIDEPVKLSLLAKRS